MEKLEKEISILEKELSQDNQEIAFCHNDLQYGNIMIDEETRSITFIVSVCFGFCSILLLFIANLSFILNSDTVICNWVFLSFYVVLCGKSSRFFSGISIK